MSQYDIEQDGAAEAVPAQADAETPEASADPTADEVPEVSTEAQVEADAPVAEEAVAVAEAEEPTPADPVAETEVVDEPVDELPEEPAEPTEEPAAEAGDEAGDEDVEPEDAEDAGETAAEDDPLEEFRRELWAKPGEWYVVHTYYGMENRVRQNLENRIVSLNMEDYIHEIVVPTEEVAEIKNGQRKMVKRTVLPGYVLVRMDLTDESWAAVRHTPSVTGFVGQAHQPVPLSMSEVENMLAPTIVARPRRPPAPPHPVAAPRPPPRSRSRSPTSVRATR